MYLCVSVDCCTGQSFCGNKFKFCISVITCNMYMHISLLVIAAVCILQPYLFFYFYSCNSLSLSEAKCLNYVCTNMGSYMYTTISVQLNIYLQCSNHICSVYMSNMFAVLLLAWLVAVTDFIGGTFMQGSQHTWKTWKNDDSFSSHGKIMEFYN